MKIVADENIPLVENFFQGLGKIVRLPGRQMSAADVADADILLVRSVTRVDENLLATSSVGFVGTCTIGVDHLDQQFLQSRNIRFASAPGCNANSVVEYVYSALCHLDVNWLPLSFGIIGCGNVGGLLYRRLRAQGVQCFCYDPFLTLEDNPDLVSLEKVLACDVISLHTPLTTTGAHPTHHLLGANELQKLKSGAVLLNCGRGPVVDNKALLDLMLARPDLRVVLDVWETEPEISLPLLQKTALGTPHIAGYSYDGKLKGTEMIYNSVCNFLALTPQKSLQDLVPPLSDREVFLAGDSEWPLVKDAVRKIYNIAEDDRRLRDLAERYMTGAADFAQGFDLLRKHYPQRREFHNYEINCKYPTAWLESLGFNSRLPTA